MEARFQHDCHCGMRNDNQLNFDIRRNFILLIYFQTTDSYLLFYRLQDTSPEGRGLYEQRDSPVTSLKRDSAELFIKEIIPSLVLTFVSKCTIYFFIIWII